MKKLLRSSAVKNKWNINLYSNIPCANPIESATENIREVLHC